MVSTTTAIIIAIILVVIFVTWPAACDTIHNLSCSCGMQKTDSYMRSPLERFTAAGNPYCCRFKFSPHQYPIIPVPSDLFNTWYRLV